MTPAAARFWRAFPAFFIGLLLLLGGSVSLSGYALHGYSWPAGADIRMHLQLTRASGALQDGSASWNASAADALNIWNQYVEVVTFVSDSPSGSTGEDGANEVFFSNSVYGEAWPTNTLAVTLRMSSEGSVFTETDVLFNANLKWDSYRGAAQGFGTTGTYDLHRVALHEFGHVLGLDHPDQYSQSVTAIMNSTIGSLDHLTDDDIAGARALYASKITSSLTPPSGTTGSNFSYQITANNKPTSFTASGLPPGLELNTVTGFISGTPTRGGTSDVQVTAQGPRGTASAIVKITVAGPTITSNLSPPGVAVGNDFTYQITASSASTAYEATGLPPGLELDANTGIISGVPTISGTYFVTILARGSAGEAVARLTLSIPPNPVPPHYDEPSLTLPVGNGPIATDLARSRLYVAHQNSIAVVDTVAPHVVTTIPISDHYNATTLTLSPDGKVLWFVRTNDTIGRIDLETLTALPDLPTNELVLGLREGLDHRLYCPSWSGGMLQLDAVTGATLAHFDVDKTSSGLPNYCSVEISPDRKTLFVGLSPAVPGINKYDVSTATPKLLETVQQNGNLGNLGVSHDGTRLCFWTSGTGTNEFDTSNITQPLGLLVYQEPTFYGPVFAQDDSLIFQLGYVRNGGPQLAIFNAATRQLVRAIDLPPKTYGYQYVGTEASNTYVIVCGGGQNGDPPRLLFYPIQLQTVPVPPHSLLNVSTRLRAQPGDNALIGGFIIRGQEPKKVVLRAIGPSLPVSDRLADPVLQVFDSSGVVVAQNDNWNAHRNDVIATGIPPSDEHEAVVAATLNPGSYTAVVRGLNSSSGVALVEAYDLSPAPDSKLANISTRGKVEGGDNVMIGGFIVGGDQQTRVVVRAIGPSLANFGIGNALTDPTLELHDSNGAVIALNDNWRESQEQQLTDAGLAPSDNREAAIVLSLQPGPYTAIVRGKGVDPAGGVGLVEIYNLEAN